MFPHLVTARILLFSTVALSCTVYSAENSDPWEKTNRKIYTFNKRLDTYASYKALREAVNNLLIVNLVIQPNIKEQERSALFALAG